MSENIYNKGQSKNFDLIRPENREFYDSWKDAVHLNNLSPLTIDRYSHALRVFFSWNYEYNNDKLFTDLLNRDFTKFIQYKKSLKVTYSQLNFFRSALVSLSKYIAKSYEDLYPDYKDKASNIDSFKPIPKKERIIIDQDELQMMLDKLVEMKKYQHACWLALLAYSGCRRSEGLQIKVEWCTEKYEKFPAPYTMYKTPKIRTKGSGEEGKLIPKYIFKEAFKPYLDLWLAERERLGIKTEHLFCSIKGKGRYEEPTVNIANDFAERIRIIFKNGFHNHAMRHYFATMLRRRYFPNNIIMKIVRWSDEKMINHYDDTDDDEAIENYFNEKIGKSGASKEEMIKKLIELDVSTLSVLLAAHAVAS